MDPVQFRVAIPAADPPDNAFRTFVYVTAMTALLRFLRIRYI
ncbi:hypothetical protein BH11PSE5_BH11PSE5_00450 [soil metagenome]